MFSGEYPIIERVLPKEMPYVFSIEREVFLEVAKKAVLYANKKSYLTELIPSKNGLTIKVVDKEGGVFYFGCRGPTTVEFYSIRQLYVSLRPGKRLWRLDRFNKIMAFCGK